jgi:hypothetical protein
MKSLRRNIDGMMACDSTISVTYSYKHGTLGRRYAAPYGTAFQSIDGGLRKLLAEPYYWDLDFENCYPVLIFHICKAFGHKTPLLERFVFEREKMLGELMRFYECDRHAAKNLVLKHLHGGKVRKWLTDFNISKDVCAKVAKVDHHWIVTSLEKECDRITKFFMDTFPEFKDLLQQIHRKQRADGVLDKDLKGDVTALAHGLATFEDRLLRSLEQFLKEEGYRVDSLEYDGLKVWRAGETGEFPKEVLRKAEDFLAKQDLNEGGSVPVRVPMKLAEKPLKSAYAAVLR